MEEKRIEEKQRGMIYSYRTTLVTCITIEEGREKVGEGARRFVNNARQDEHERGDQKIKTLWFSHTTILPSISMQTPGLATFSAPNVFTRDPSDLNTLVLPWE